MPVLRWNISGHELELYQGDLTTSPFPVIVNAANAGLKGGGGVDGMIHAAAGPELIVACRNIIASRGPLLPGEAVITSGFNMKATHIIHTVGPIWRGGGRNEPEQLEKAYNSCLQLAATHYHEQIDFPAISCGTYGYPIPSAAPVAFESFSMGLQNGVVKRIRLTLYSDASWKTWSELAMRYFGQGS